jgi:hypothetical protein
MSAIENDSAFLALPSDLASEIMLRYLELHHQLVISATCRALHLLYYEKLRRLVFRGSVLVSLSCRPDF